MCAANLTQEILTIACNIHYTPWTTLIHFTTPVHAKCRASNGKSLISCHSSSDFLWLVSTRLCHLAGGFVRARKYALLVYNLLIPSNREIFCFRGETAVHRLKQALCQVNLVGLFPISSREASLAFKIASCAGLHKLGVCAYAESDRLFRCAHSLHTHKAPRTRFTAFLFSRHDGNGSETSP